MSQKKSDDLYDDPKGNKKEERTDEKEEKRVFSDKKQRTKGLGRINLFAMRFLLLVDVVPDDAAENEPPKMR